MSQAPLEDEIRGFLTRTFLFEFEGNVNEDTDLFEAGLIDSYGFIELVKFLEGTFGLKLSDDDLASPAFATLSGITLLVSERRSPGQVAGQVP